MVVHAEFETFPAKAGRSPRVNLVGEVTPEFGVIEPSEPCELREIGDRSCQPVGVQITVSSRK